jgi:hypothetical protein
VILAMGDGKRSARAIDDYLSVHADPPGLPQGADAGFP